MRLARRSFLRAAIVGAFGIPAAKAGFGLDKPPSLDLITVVKTLESPLLSVIDLTQLAATLQITPEPIYLFSNYASRKYGPGNSRKGTRTQVERLAPIGTFG